MALLATPVHALDKQGSAHGGSIEVPESGFDASGSFSLGMSLYNPSYAARPDNTGRALMRYAGHVDLDLIGRRLSVPLDVNVFTDGEQTGVRNFRPSELDVIAGLATTWKIGPGALEVGTRVEHDRPTDRGGVAQTYGDARARYLFSLASVVPSLGPALRGGDISGWATLGWFAYNKSYFARPDNTGVALFRYALHTELSTFDDLISFGVDATMFTDRNAGVVVRPSELDLTPEIILRRGANELHVAWETDMPIDRGGLVQRFVFVLFARGWSASQAAPPPVENRRPIPSP